MLHGIAYAAITGHRASYYRAHFHHEGHLQYMTLHVAGPSHD